MSLLADLFVSSDQEAVKYDSNPEYFKTRAQFTSITFLELSMLWAIIEGKEWKADSLDEFNCLLQLEDGSKMIYRLPDRMTTNISKLNKEDLEIAVKKWAATEELNCSPNDIRPIVEELVRLANQAHKTDQNVYLWNCL